MRTVTEFPNAVRDIEHTWIEMADGTRLAARIWLPEDAMRHPVPAIFEYIPYRKRDSIRLRDETMHPYFAGHGYAAVRVDLRGSGDSEGVLRDEYLEQELDDGVEVIRWLAAQDWCDGSVGMIGISWGGFNGLQIAAMRPPALHAIVTVCSSDDRYADDVHHMGGCLLGDNLSWASVMFAYNALPPDPAVVGERWREMWRARLDGSGLWLEKWLRHQRRDAYWRHGSICEDYGAVGCPVMAVSGWADGYSNAVFRLLANLDVPRRGLVGPWGHKYPHLGVPGPAIGFLQECVRWWDRWLKDVPNGVEDEPALCAWMQASAPPTARYAHRPGRWVAEPSWPSPRVREQAFALAPGRLLPEGEGPDEVVTVQSPLTVGLFAGKWCSYAAGPDLAHDQRQEDGGALVFDGEPLAADLEILGAPVLELDVAADRPSELIDVRPSDRGPARQAQRVTYGLLNLTHRASPRFPEPLEPGRFYRVEVKLNDIAQGFPAGHRLRLALSSSYWPLAWPPPAPTRLSVRTKGARLRLPVRPATSDDAASAPFGPPEGATPERRVPLTPGHHNWLVHRDLAADASTLEVVNDHGTFRIPEIDLVVEHDTREWYRSVGDDFTSACGETRTTRNLTRGDWAIRTTTRTLLTSTATDFRVRAELDAWEGETRVHAQSWDERIPRDHV
ncbi:CocE/NonD family hydrolase [Thiohalocapsa sp.]|uniref:CocE/NonD family hydrolase n=1 Tax=Thiohalocapsa sp. TaxID=2497641 RepID=UPI0025E6AB40|nr:CocE/NonD family hydrolase [Thiohalocapsa sp.]